MDMPPLSGSTLLYFLAFVVPGFLSMQIYAQIRPRQRATLKDTLLEAIAFGLINFVLLIWGVLWVMDARNYATHPILVYLLVIVIFLVMPAVWPLVLIAVQNRLAEWNLFLATSPTAWDHYFQRRRPCWVIVHLGDGKRIGGHFGHVSYASAYPEPGHIYLEELWTLNDQGGFVAKIPQSRGIILRPADYHMIEMFED